MCISIKKIVLLFLILFSVTASQAQVKYPYRQWRLVHRVSASSVVSFYKNNPDFTINTKAKPGFSFTYKSELFAGRKASLLFGLEYFNQGLSFNGYYAHPGNTYLFDETFSYKHDVRIQEVQLPLAFKISFNSEKEKLYSSYFFGGVGARYIIGSYAFITNDSTGNAVYDNKAKVDFEYQFITKGMNAFLLGGLGIQSNFKKSAGAAFFEITYKYGISRLHYNGNQNSNNLNIKDAHLALSIGLRF